MRARSIVVAGLLLAAASAGARAQDARAQDEACAFKWPVTREREAFAGSLPAVATGGRYEQPGAAIAVTLAPEEAVAYTVKPKRAPKVSPAYGAELTATIQQAGTYQVTLSDDAWVDLAQNGRTLRSSAFSGKPGCPGVRKSVRFALEAGPVTLAISDAPQASLKLDMVPAQ